MRALIIREPWISLILSGAKTWEMRSKATKIRGKIGLIAKGTGMVIGTADLIDCLPALDRGAFRHGRECHRIPSEMEESAFRQGWLHPWVLRDARRLQRPVHAGQKPGQVIWVSLSELVATEIASSERAMA